MHPPRPANLYPLPAGPVRQISLPDARKPRGGRRNPCRAASDDGHSSRQSPTAPGANIGEHEHGEKRVGIEGKKGSPSGPLAERLDETGSSQLRGALARRRTRDATGRHAGRTLSRNPLLCVCAPSSAEECRFGCSADGTGPGPSLTFVPEMEKFRGYKVEQKKKLRKKTHHPAAGPGPVIAQSNMLAT